MIVVIMAFVLWWLPLNGVATAITVAQDDAAIFMLQQRVLPLQRMAHLDPLVQRCAGVQLVLLGDGTHGGEEFYYLRRLLSVLLVQQQSISFIALEADWDRCLALDRYVRDLPGAADSAAYALEGFDSWRSWVWRNGEIALLLDELRAINLRRPLSQRVAVYGIDMLDYGLSLQKLAAVPALATAAQALGNCLPGAGMLPDDYFYHLQAGGTSCELLATALAQRLPRGAQVFPRDISALDFDLAQQMRVVQRGEAHYRVQVLKPEWAWNLRVRHFAQTLQQLLKRHGSAARGIVWAHNTHVGDGRATQMYDCGIESLGQLVRRRMGASRVFLLGQTGFSGAVRASRGWGGEAQVLPVPPACADSSEALLHRSGIAAGMWLFSETDAATALNIPRWQRAIGVTYEPGNDIRDNYVMTRLTQRYDALIYIDQMTALLPLSESKP
ncbi:MAG: erythromycin esterase family protein [Thermodesulfobacteriota bacterium]|nr:erythromycin esterase family protein [Thermodesulfobacteriota bacterium]